MTTDDLARLRSLAEAADAAQDQPPDNHHAGMPEWTAVNDYFDSPLIGPEPILALLDAAALGLALRSMVEDIIGQHDHFDWSECAPDVLVRQLQNALALAEKLEAREP